jgi:hypothetical protein
MILVVELCHLDTATGLSNLSSWAIPLAISTICISLASNAIVTGLLVLRIAIVHRRYRCAIAAMTQDSPRVYDVQVSPIISILIETGMMTFVSQLVLVIALGLRNASALVVGSPIIMIYVG